MRDMINLIESVDKTISLTVPLIWKEYEHETWNRYKGQVISIKHQLFAGKLIMGCYYESKDGYTVEIYTGMERGNKHKFSDEISAKKSLLDFVIDKLS